MVEFPDLPDVIQSVGVLGKSLAQLADSPTSAAVVGVLAKRCQFEIRSQDLCEEFDLYVFDDRGRSAVRWPSPFAVLCVGTQQLSGAQELWGQMNGLLRERDLHARPVMLLFSDDFGSLVEHVELSEIVTVPLAAREIVAILLSHPPRVALMNQLTARTSLSTLNPYVYRGPIGENLFVGRLQQLNRLCGLCRFETSYALVGPRAIGKTSLINRAYDMMRREGEFVIRVEFSENMSEHHVVEQVLAFLVDNYEARASIQSRMSPVRLTRQIEKFAKRSPSKRVAIFVDEADGLDERCPRLATTFRTLHNHGFARFVLVGYKQLRRAVNDSQRSELMNVLTEIPLSRLKRRECGELVNSPMTELGIHVADPTNVVEAIYVQSGGAPNRIQLLCHALVERLEETDSRTVTREDAEGAAKLPLVRKVLARWFNESTSPIEKFVASVASINPPWEEEELIAKVRKHLQEMSTHEIRAEIQDLVISDILDYRANGQLDFTFPAAVDLARPVGNAKEVMAELRRCASQLRREHVEGKS